MELQNLRDRDATCENYTDFFMEKGNLFGLNSHKSLEDREFVDFSSPGPLYILRVHRLLFPKK